MNDDAILQKILSRLPRGENLALVAPSGRERTALLRKVGDPDVVSTRLPSNLRWTFLFLSAADFPPTATANDFWKVLWRGFANRLAGTPWQAEVAALVHSRRPFGAERMLRNLARADVRLVLLLDGVDQFAENPRMFTTTFLAPLRSLSSRFTAFSVVLGSELPLKELNRRAAMAGSPAFNVFQEIFPEEVAAA